MVTLRKNGVANRTSSRESLKEIGYHGIRRGDLVMARGWTDLPGRSGYLALPDKLLLFIRCVNCTLNADAYFYAYACTRNAEIWVESKRSSEALPSVLPTFATPVSPSSTIPLATLPEQRAIARYLDYMDRRIQRYIKAQRAVDRVARGTECER